MAEKSDVPQSAYAVALELALLIATAEGKQFGVNRSALDGGADRTYVLDLYGMCLKAMRPIT